MPDQSPFVGRVPLAAPDGSVRLIPEPEVSAALNAGGRHVVTMLDPQGKQRWIPADQVDAATKAGGQLLPGVPSQAPPMQKEGLVPTLASAAGGALIRLGRQMAATESLSYPASTAFGGHPAGTITQGPSPLAEIPAQTAEGLGHLLEAAGPNLDWQQRVLHGVGGALQAGTPFMVPEAAEGIDELLAGNGGRLLRMLGAFGAGAAGQVGGEKAATALGAKPETAQAVGALSGLGTGGIAGLLGGVFDRFLPERAVPLGETPHAGPVNAQAPLSEQGQLPLAFAADSVAPAPPIRGDVSTTYAKLGLTKDQWDALPPDQQQALAAMPEALQPAYRKARAPLEETATPSQSPPNRLRNFTDTPQVDKGAGWSLNQATERALAFSTLNPDGSPRVEMLLEPVNGGRDWRIGYTNAEIERRGFGSAAYNQLRDVAAKHGIGRIYAGENQSTGASALWRRLLERGAAQLDEEGRPYIPTGDRRVDARLRQAIEARGARRAHKPLRQAFDQMDDEEKFQQTYIDPATGLLNRKAFDLMEGREKSPAVAMIDVQGLGAFNDSFGHEAGDWLLKRQAEVLKNEGLDVYRVGGDELGVRGTDPVQLKAALERARAKLRSSPVEVTHKESGYTGSLLGTPEFLYGIGPDLKTADEPVTAAKAHRSFPKGTLDPALVPPEMAERIPALLRGSNTGYEAGGIGPGAQGEGDRVGGEGNGGPLHPVRPAVSADTGTVGAEGGVGAPSVGEGGGGPQPNLGRRVQEALSRWVAAAKASGKQPPYDIEEPLRDQSKALLGARRNLQRQLAKNPGDTELQKDLADTEAQLRDLQSQLIQMLPADRQEAALRDAEQRAQDWRQRRQVALHLLRPETTPTSLWEAISHFDPTTREHLRQIFGPTFERTPRAVGDNELASLGLDKNARRGRGIQSALQDAIDRDEAELAKTPSGPNTARLRNRLEQRRAFLTQMQDAEEHIAAQLPIHEEDFKNGVARSAQIKSQIDHINGRPARNGEAAIPGRNDVERARLFAVERDATRDADERAAARAKADELTAQDNTDLRKLEAALAQQDTVNRKSAKQIRLLRNLAKRPKNVVMQPAGEFPVNSVFTPGVMSKLAHYIQRGPSDVPNGEPLPDLTRPYRPADIRATSEAPDPLIRAAAKQIAFRNNIYDLLNHPHLGLGKEADFWMQHFNALRKATGAEGERPIDRFMRAERGETKPQAAPTARLVSAVESNDPHNERAAVAEEVNAPVEAVKAELPTPQEAAETNARARAVAEYNSIKESLPRLDPNSLLAKQSTARMEELQKQIGEEPKPDVNDTRPANDPRRIKRNQSGETTLDVAATPAYALGSFLRKLGNALEQTTGSLDKVQGMLRNNYASLARWREVALKTLEPVAKSMDKYTPEQFRDFVHRMEQGLPQTTPALQTIANQLRAMLDDRRQALQASGHLEEFNENYFPHLWEEFRKSRRNFLRARTYTSIEDGLDAGLTPLSYNPVRMVLAHLEQVDRFLSDERTFQEAKEFQYVKWLPVGKPLPEGWRHLASPRFNPKVNALDEGHLKEYGSYIAPEPVANLFDNLTKPGLRGNWLYDVLHHYGMRANMVQLGASAFHAVFSSINATADQMALGLEQVINEGKFGEGLGNIAASPAASVRYLVKGNALMQAYLDPAKQVKLQRLVDALELGGGRAYMDSFYRTNTMERFRTAWKDFQNDKSLTKLPKGVKAAWRGLDLAFNKLNAPILEYLVPRMKLASFANAAQDALSRMDSTVDLDARRQIFGKIWDQVDNRFGELVYDNLFWKRTAKDLGMISVRSLGWNIGSIREFGGATGDWAQFLAGKNKFTNRMGYTLALPLINGLINGIYTRLATGTMPHGMDYFAARDGKLNPDGTPHRVWPPTYMKDLIHLGMAVQHDALEFPSVKNTANLVGNKLNPGIEQIYDVLRNRDYYGREITHGGETPSEQIKSYANYFWNVNQPLSFQNAAEIRRAGGGIGEQIQSGLGITPAPRHLADTPTEQVVDDAMTRLRSIGPMTQSSYDAMQLKSRLRDEFRQGTVNKKDLQAAAANPAIGGAGLKRVEVQSRENPLAFNFKRIPFADAVRALQLANPAERKLLLPIMAQRLPELLKQTPDQRAYYMPILHGLFNGKKGK